MPLIVKWPGVIKPSSLVTELVQNLDYAQTFLEIAGASQPKDMQGLSLVPLMKGEKPTNWRNEIYYHYYEYPKWHMVQPHYGIRTKRFKLIHFYYSMDEWELYDLDVDPNEINNLYGKVKYNKLVKLLKKKLKKLQIQYNDDMSLDEMRAMTDVVVERVYNEENLNTR
mgnify:CR=1 FL=1